MDEVYLRKWHGRLGIFLALFILLQAASGVVLNLEDLVESFGILGWANVFHRGGGDFGTVYRTLLGLGLMGMAASGSLIFYKIWHRTRKK
jgi:hypothetical protein